MNDQNKLAGLGIAIVAVAVAVWGVATLRSPDLSSVAQEYDSGGGGMVTSTPPTLELRSTEPGAAPGRTIHITTNRPGLGIFAFDVVNRSDEPVRIQNVSVAISSTPLAAELGGAVTLANFKLIRGDTNTQVGTTVGKPVADPTPGSRFGLIAFTNVSVRIEAGATFRFLVRTDVRTLRQGAASGSQHRLLIPEGWMPRGVPAIAATGVSTSRAAILAGSAYGDTYTVYAGILRARLNAASPAGLAAGAAEQTIAIFDLWRTDEGERLPIMKDYALLNFSSTIRNTRERNLRLYYEAPGRARRRIGSAVLPVGEIPRTVSVRIGQIKITARQAAPGRLTVTMDTTDAGAGRTLTTTLQNIFWTDQVTRSITDVMDLPIIGRTLSY